MDIKGLKGIKMFIWEYSEYSKIDENAKKHFPFDEPRKDQLETISEIIDAMNKGYKYIVLEAGTGTGKSAIAATLNQMCNSSYIFTITKQLQDQYLNDFKDLGFKLVKGRSNFKCRKYMEEGSHKCCDEGKCVIEGYRCEYSLDRPNYLITEENTCYYYYQKWVALNANTVISNYHYLFLELNYVQDFLKRDLIVFDEAHNLEELLMKLLKLEFNRKDLKEYLGINLSSEVIKQLEKGNYKTWINFIQKVRERYSEELNNIIQLKNKSELHEKISFMKKQIFDCDRFIENINKDPRIWIFDYDSEFHVAEFKPLKVDNYAKDTLLKFGDVCLFMSATILDYRVFGNWLGIDSTEIYPIRRKSPFDIKRNAIKTFNKYSLSKKLIKKNAPKTIDILKVILERHKNEKGIIHTVSGKCKDFLIKELNNPRLITHNSENRLLQLEKFKSSHEPLVLISPSMNEGVDLPGELCRFQVMYKIPYPDLGDKQVFLRNQIDDLWYDYKTAMELVQTHGRGMRYEEDYCMTYFIDNRLKGFITKDLYSNNFLPEYFRSCIDTSPLEIEKDDDYFANESYIEKIERKYKLTIRANQFLKEERFDMAIKVYNSLLSHELFINDYHPYRKLARAYHGAGLYEKEADIIVQFFKSGRYCNANRLKWFKDRLKDLSDKGYFNKSEIPNLEREFEKNGALNKVLSYEPVLTAYDIKRNKRNNQRKAESNYPPEYFDDICNMDYNMNYDGQVRFKYKLYQYGNNLIKNKKLNEAIGFYNRLLTHELFINDYHPYKKLAKVYRRNKQYDDAANIIVSFFKSGIYCNHKQFDWFVNQLNDLGKYGNFDLRLLNDLKEEFFNNGALNKSKSNKPVPIAYRLRKLIQTQVNHRQSDDYIKNYFSSLNKNSLNNHIPAVDEKYDSKYFYNLADEISQDPNFISDEKLLEDELDDCISIDEDYDIIKQKYELIMDGKELECDNYKKAIDFYENLRNNELFSHDYYPYRKLCFLFEKEQEYNHMFDTIVDLFSHEIYCNDYHYIWFNNRISDLIEKLDLGDDELLKLKNLFYKYDFNEDEYKLLQNSSIPIADRIIKCDGEIKLLSESRFNYLQEIFYKKELGEELLARKEYESAIDYHVGLLKENSLNLKYFAYNKLAIISEEMINLKKFKRLYKKSLKYYGLD